jgi:hypothetical protein
MSLQRINLNGVHELDFPTGVSSATIANGVTTINLESGSEIYPVTLRVVSSSALTTGAQNSFGQVTEAGTIVSWSITADQSGSVSVDVWKAASSAFPAAPTIPTSANKISASAGPSLSSAQSASENAAGLTGWTTAVSQYDVFGFNIASASTVKAITLQIWIQRS